jgi:hypothetical protein
MSGIDYQVHNLIELKGRRGMKVVDYNNPKAYVRLSCKDGTAYIQKGKIMYEDGVVISPNKMPEWLAAEIKKCDPASLRDAGFNVKGILDELEAAKKAKGAERTAAKKEAAKAAAKAAAKKAQKRLSRAEVPLPDEVPEPEPEDVGLTEETEEETEND